MSLDEEPDAPLHGECEAEISVLTAERDTYKAQVDSLRNDAERGIVIPKELFDKLPAARRAIGDLVGYVRTEKEKDYFSRLGCFIGQHLAIINEAKAKEGP